MFQHGKKAKINLNLAWFLVSLAMLFYLYDIFLQVSPSVMVAQLVASFHIDALHVGDLSASFFYVYTIMMLPVGLLYDRFRLRAILLSAVLVCTLGTFLFCFAPTVWVAKFGRFFMGFGSAFAFIGVLKLATRHLPEKYLAFIAGVATTLGMVGAMMANLVLTHLVHTLGWRHSMFITACVGILIFILFLLFLRRPKKQLHFSLHHKPKQFKTLFYNLYLLVKLPAAWINGFIAFLLFLPVTAFASLWAVPYLKQAQGYSPELSGVINAMLFLGVAIGGPTIGVLSNIVSRRRLFLMFGSLVCCIALTFIIFTPHLKPIFAGTLFFITGFFVGAESLCFPIANEISPPAISAVAFAFTNFIINLSGSVFQPVIGALLDAKLGHLHAAYHATRHFAGIFEIALSVVPIACLIAFVLSFFLRETYCRVTP